MDPSTPAALRWRRGVVFLAALALLLLSCPHRARGQEAATLVDESASASAGEGEVAGGDVTDLGDVVGDAMADLTGMAEGLGSEGAAGEGAAGVGGDTVAEKGAEAEATDATDATAAAAGEAAPEATAPDASAEAEASTGASDATPETTDAEAQAKGADEAAAAPVVQSGPFIDLLGDVLLSLEMVDETHAQVHQHYTNEALEGKKVVGLYFSADWCGPCRQFTPDLVNFYNKMNARRGKQNEFEIVWISRCRDVDSFGQYFTHMNWLALPPNEAMGPRGQYLGEKYKVKSIPTLVLLDEIGNVITTDGRNKIPMDKAGIGFPWRSPVSVLISTLVPRSFRLMAKSQFAGVLGLLKKVLLGKGSKLKEAVAGGGGGP